MKIRRYIDGDENRLEANEFSGVDDIRHVFSNDRFTKYTMVDECEIKCIMCWLQHAPFQYAAFFLMPDGLDFKHARTLKRFVDDVTLELRPKSVITFSHDCDMLNRWHKFLGFKMQRKSLDDLAEGFNRWMIKWA